MIATASYSNEKNYTYAGLSMSHSVTDDCTGSTTDGYHYTCADATCDCHGTCDYCCTTATHVTEREDEQVKPADKQEMLPIRNINLNRYSLGPSPGVRTMFHMSHRSGSTNKKIKQWSGFIQ